MRLSGVFVFLSPDHAPSLKIDELFCKHTQLSPAIGFFSQYTSIGGQTIYRPLRTATNNA